MNIESLLPSINTSQLLCFHDRKVLGVRFLGEVIQEDMKQFPLPSEIITNSLAAPFIDKAAKVQYQWCV
jgi:hypothetical protein